MSVWDVLLDVWQNGGQVVVLGGAGYAVASARAAPGGVKSNDRRVAVLRRDLRRWMHDRDRQLAARQKLIEAYARKPGLEGELVNELVALRAPVPEELKQFPAGSQYHSGAHVRMQADARETRCTSTATARRRPSTSWTRSGSRRARGTGGFAAAGGCLLQWSRSALPSFRYSPSGALTLTSATVWGPRVKDVSRADGEARLRALETLAQQAGATHPGAAERP